MELSSLAIKILSSDQIRAADAYTIKHEPIASIDLMERASEAFVNWFVDHFNQNRKVNVFCGTGNNGGDGLAISRLLIEQGYNISTFTVGNIEKATPDFLANLKRLKSICDVQSISSNVDFPILTEDDIVIDGLFGSGLSRPIQGFYAEVINHINRSESSTVISIDIPSGLFSDKETTGDSILKSTYTISFQVPKLAFMLPKSALYCGDFYVQDIGLSQSYIKELPSNYFLVNENLINSIFKKRSKFIHKGNVGRCLIISGSRGKIGAAILASRACLRSGAGLVTVHTPKCGYMPIQASVPEAMVIEDQKENEISHINDIQPYDSIGVGPGIGTSETTTKAFETFIKSVEKPIVLDADAINIISKNPNLIDSIPNLSILTPHPGEFKRLVGDWTTDFERLQKQIELSKRHQLIVLLKGPSTSITVPDGTVFFNSTGNSGMATAGSGDVLTGIITSFIGQGYEPQHAAILGAYAHGLSGDLFVNQCAKEPLMAGDLINCLSKTFVKINSL